jgi:transposase
MSMEAKEKKQKRRRYTDEFKAGAVALVVKEKRSVSSVAKDLGLSTSVIHSWVQQSKAAGGRGAMPTADKDELARLIKENRVLKMERDILKKAAAFFARESA